MTKDQADAMARGFLVTIFPADDARLPGWVEQLSNLFMGIGGTLPPSAPRRAPKAKPKKKRR